MVFSPDVIRIGKKANIYVSLENLIFSIDGLIEMIIGIIRTPIDRNRDIEVVNLVVDVRFNFWVEKRDDIVDFLIVIKPGIFLDYFLLVDVYVVVFRFYINN